MKAQQQRKLDDKKKRDALAADPGSPAPSTISASSTRATCHTAQGSAAAQLIDVEMRKEQRLVRESEIQRLNWLITKAKSVCDDANPHHLNSNLATYERDLEILYLTPLINTPTAPNLMFELADAPVFFDTTRGVIPHSPVSMFPLLPKASTPRFLHRDFLEDVSSKVTEQDMLFVSEFDDNGQFGNTFDGDDFRDSRNYPFPSFPHHISPVCCVAAIPPVSHLASTGTVTSARASD